FFFSSRRRHTRFSRDWSSDVCSSDLVLDTADGSFLSTGRRRALLADLPLVSVPVLWDGPGSTLAHLRALLGPSRYKTPHWKERQIGRASCRERVEESVGGGAWKETGE